MKLETYKAVKQPRVHTALPSCDFTEGVGCSRGGSRDCRRCGHNPYVARGRIAKIRAAGIDWQKALRALNSLELAKARKG